MSPALGTRCGHDHQREDASESGGRSIPLKFRGELSGLSLTSRNVMASSLIPWSDKRQAAFLLNHG